MRTRIATRNSAKGKGMRRTSRIVKNRRTKARAYAALKAKKDGVVRSIQ